MWLMNSVHVFLSLCLHGGGALFTVAMTARQPQQVSAVVTVQTLRATGVSGVIHKAWRRWLLQARREKSEEGGEVLRRLRRVEAAGSGCELGLSDGGGGVPRPMSWSSKKDV